MVFITDCKNDVMKHYKDNCKNQNYTEEEAEEATKSCQERVYEREFSYQTSGGTQTFTCKQFLNNVGCSSHTADCQKCKDELNACDKEANDLVAKLLVVEKNIALLADAYKNDNYLQKIDMNNPSLFLYNGDMVKLLQTLKQKVNNLTPEEELTFDYDYTTGETRIHTSYSAGEDLIVKRVDYYDGAMKNTGVSSGIEGRNAMGTKTLNTSFQDLHKVTHITLLHQ